MTELSLIAPIRILLLETLAMVKNKLPKKQFIKVLSTIICELLMLHPDLTPPEAKKRTKSATGENYSPAYFDSLRGSEIAEKPKAVKKAKPKARAKAAKKTPKVSATETVLSIIKRSRKGVDVATMKTKTGFEGQKVRNIIYRLKRKGKIQSTKRGIYL